MTTPLSPAPETDATHTHIREKLNDVTHAPGVYLLKDANNKILYVGKARSLKKRLSSYFIKKKLPEIKTKVLVRKTADFETIVTSTEKEALILESNLIKKYKPRYNIDLKDDKRYPSLRLDIKDPYPKIEIVRKIQKDGALYFGPYASATSVRQTVKFINRHFMLRKCSGKKLKKRTRPCLNYQMKTCIGLCVNPVDKTEYKKTVDEVVLFLKGRASDLIEDAKQQMFQAAKQQAFEKAAMLRDKIRALEKTLEKQMTVTTDFVDRDVLALAGSSAFYVITVFNVRRGFLSGNRHFSFENTVYEHSALMEQFIKLYYDEQRFVPAEILVSHACESNALLEEKLSEIRGKKAVIFQPQKGDKLKLLNMAIANAGKELSEKIRQALGNKEIIEGLKKKLNMEKNPVRIECFDNSNLAGTNPVAAMVVFKNGRPDKKSYRKYIIKTVLKGDDYGYMEEVLSRRLKKEKTKTALPDLLMVDGGKGQLNIALRVIDELGLSGRFAVAGIAKKDEKKGEVSDKVYLPQRANPVVFGAQGKLLLFLQQIRDEAHRFAITFQRSKRAKDSMSSALDRVPGVGKKRKAMLLKHFGGLKKIRAATVHQISELPGITRQMAKDIKKSLL